MKRKIKSYLVFTSYLYRAVMFGAVPAAALAVYVLFTKTTGFSWLLSIPVVVILVEIAADNWMFGGIQGKDAEKMDFLKTSSHGMQIMQDALLLDLLRRLLSLAGISAVCVLAGAVLGDDMLTAPGELAQKLLCVMFVSYDISVLGTLLARFGSAVWINFVIGYAGIVLGAIGSFLMMSVNTAVSGLILAVLAALLSILAVKTAMRKIRGGYYDK